MDVENKLIILTCDVLEYWYRTSREEEKKKEEAKKRRSREGKICARKLKWRG